MGGEQVSAFTPHSPLTTPKNSRSRNTLSMAFDVDVDQVAAPAVQERPAVEMVVKSPGGGPTDVRYSEFLRLVDADKIEKVTFSSDGTQLLGVDVDGTRLKIQSLPNDPDLLSQLTTHKVDVTVLPQQEASGLGDLAQSLIFPAALFAGLFFLSRRGGAPGGMGGP